MKYALLFLIYFAIIQKIGFYSLTSFLLILFAVIFTLAQLFNMIPKKTSLFLKIKYWDELISFGLILIGAAYYGGLYQSSFSIILGRLLLLGFFALAIFIYIFKISLFKFVFVAGLFVYLFVGYWTILNSPNPRVDSFVILKEAPQKFLQGLNPYDQNYSRVYNDVTPDYFNYLPLSFIFYAPVVSIFGDPRYILPIMNVVGAVLLLKMIGAKCLVTKNKLYMAVWLLLFFPGAFYMQEHVYLDMVIFFFLILFFYFSINRRDSLLSPITLALFFSFKHLQILTLPFFLQKKSFRKNFFRAKFVILFFVPFMAIVYFFLLNPGKFLNNIIGVFKPGVITSPIDISLTLPTFLKNEFSIIPEMAYTLGGLLFAFLYFLILLSKAEFTYKMFALFLFFNFCLYHAFFNSYYWVGLLLWLDIFYGANIKESFEKSFQ